MLKLLLLLVIFSIFGCSRWVRYTYVEIEYPPIIFEQKPYEVKPYEEKTKERVPIQEKDIQPTIIEPTKIKKSQMKQCTPYEKDGKWIYPNIKTGEPPVSPSYKLKTK